MADGSSRSVGMIALAPCAVRQTGSMKQLARRKSSVAFVLCLPLILLICGCVIYPACHALFLGIADPIRGDVFQWGEIMAACLLASLPPIVICASLLDDYVAGLTAEATKF